MDWPKALGIAATSLAVFGGLYAWGERVDGRYLHVTDFKRYAEDSERDRLEFQLQQYRDRLDFLRSKETRTADEEDEVKYLVDNIARLKARLAKITEEG